MPTLLIDPPAIMAPLDAWLAHRQRIEALIEGEPDNPRLLTALRECDNVIEAARALVGKFDPNQPRVPAGHEGGGRWTDGSASVLFEVAPNPDNKALLDRWNKLSDEEREAITEELSGEFAPQIMEALGVKGNVEEAVGGFEGQINPALVLTVDKKAFETAGAIGDAFQQKAMVVMSDKPQTGLSPVGMVAVVVPQGSVGKLRTIQDGVGDLADGWTYHNGRMQFLNFSGQSDDDFAAEIDKRLGGGYRVEHSTVYSAYVEEKDYVRPQSDAAGNAWGQVRGNVREAFSQRLEEKLGSGKTGKGYRSQILEKFDPNQPRDPKGTPTGGQWTSTGASPGADELKGGGVIMVKDSAGREAPVTEDSSLAKFLVKNPDGTYSLDPEREKLHQEIVDRFLSEAEPVNGQAEFFMTGGGPASGKSSILMANDDLPGPGDAVLVDPDAVKLQLPEFNERFAAGDKTAGSFVHEESSLIRRRLESAAIAGNYNVLLDTTGDSSVEKLAKNVEAYRSAGYSVKAYYATNSVDLAIQLANERGKKTGRYVPETFLRETHGAVSRTFEQATKRNLFDHVQLYDTNILGTPRLVATGTRNKFTVHDQALWQQFKDKGK